MLCDNRIPLLIICSLEIYATLDSVVFKTCHKGKAKIIPQTFFFLLFVVLNRSLVPLLSPLKAPQIPICILLISYLCILLSNTNLKQHKPPFLHWGTGHLPVLCATFPIPSYNFHPVLAPIPFIYRPSLPPPSHFQSCFNLLASPQNRARGEGRAFW